MQDHQKLWYPEGLIDEVLPTGLASAQAWFDELRPETLGLIDESERAFIARHAPGEAIAFKWAENRGTVTVAISADGLVKPAQRCHVTSDMFGDHPPASPGDRDQPTASLPANHFWQDDTEIFGETLEEFAESFASLIANGEAEAGDVDIEAWFWSGEIRYRVGDDGITLTEIPATEGTTP